MERRFHRHWGNGGAGIFALLGQAALLMEASTRVAFALAVLWRCFPVMPMRVWGELSSNGGIIDFFRRGLGQRRLFAGALVTVPVDAGGEHRHGRPCFGAYAVQFCMKAAGGAPCCLYALGIIAVMTLFNSLSNHAVGGWK